MIYPCRPPVFSATTALCATSVHAIAAYKLELLSNMSTPDTPVKPEKTAPPITQPPLEPEESPNVVHDSAHTAGEDDAAGDEGIDDKEADDYDKVRQENR
jgi:hypothetical protein